MVVTRFTRYRSIAKGDNKTTGGENGEGKGAGSNRVSKITGESTGGKHEALMIMTVSIPSTTNLAYIKANRQPAMQTRNSEEWKSQQVEGLEETQQACKRKKSRVLDY